MSHYHRPGQAAHNTAMQNLYTPATAPQAAMSQRAVSDYRNQLDGRPDYRPNMIPLAARDGVNQPVRHISTQQQQQQRRLPVHQQPQAQVQSSPIHQVNGRAAVHVPSKQQQTTESNVTKLLPYCTVERPLDQSQVIAITDVVGSLKELTLLALAAKDGNQECIGRLNDALGNEQALSGVIDFFSDEFEID